MLTNAQFRDLFTVGIVYGEIEDLERVSFFVKPDTSKKEETKENTRDEPDDLPMNKLAVNEATSSSTGQ